MLSKKVMSLLALGAAAITVAGCDVGGPEMAVTFNDTPVMQVVTVTSKSRRPFFLQKIVANGNEGSSSCTHTSGETLAPGQSHSAFFVGCGKVQTVSVYTDQGSVAFTKVAS